MISCKLIKLTIFLKTVISHLKYLKFILFYNIRKYITIHKFSRFKFYSIDKVYYKHLFPDLSITAYITHWRIFIKRCPNLENKSCIFSSCITQLNCRLMSIEYVQLIFMVLKNCQIVCFRSYAVDVEYLKKYFFFTVSKSYAHMFRVISFCFFNMECASGRLYQQILSVNMYFFLRKAIKE